MRPALSQVSAERRRPRDDLSDGRRGVTESGTGKRILVVEDEPDILDYVASILRASGYEALEAPDAPEALAILREGVGIDLVLSDIGLPGGMDGIGLFRTVRSELPGLKVLFMSGQAQDALAGHGMTASDIELLAKPFLPEDLLSRVRRMLGDE